jgi:pimeloyl-ACP methyl ester carboxylesterase
MAAILAGASPLLIAKVMGQQTASFNFVERHCCYVRLRGGRRLAYMDIGDANASWVILHHHGIPSGRVEAKSFACLLRQIPGVRMITPDRPGIGDSDPEPKSDFLSWPCDVAALMQALGIENFAVSAISAGAPFALAVARAMPERVHVAAIASAIGPLESFDRRNTTTLECRLANNRPITARVSFTRYEARFLRHPGQLPAYAAIRKPEEREELRVHAERIQDAFQQGPHEVIHSLQLMGSPWSGWLNEVPTHVKFLHGLKDRTGPPESVRCMVSQLPNADVRWYENDDHLSLTRHHLPDLLAAAMPPV